MVDNHNIIKGKYKGKTYDELFEILKTDKNYINTIKKKEEYNNFYTYYIQRINSEKNNITILNNDNKQIKNCYHMSDIHIRVSSRRYDEYKHIFNKLYKLLKEEEDGIIVITGDLLHSKCELSANCIDLTFEFLKNLSSIFPTFLILGNHDLNLENLDEIDSITAIIKGRNIPNLYYLKDSGIYEYNNIVFGVSSLIDNKHVYANDIHSDKIKIALYHGRVAGCVNDVGFRLNQEKLLTEFDGYNFVMLGDIHTQQYLKPNVAYSSSLIMQNFSETGEHGYLKWNLCNGTSSYINISNDYSHVSFEIKENKILYNNNCYTPNEFYDVCELPPFGYFRLIPTDTNFSSIKEFKDVIIKKTTKPSFSIKPNLNSKNKSEHSFIEQNDIKTLLKKFIKENNTTHDLKEMYDIIDTIDVTDIKEQNPIEWRIKMLEFDNMFSYGEGNIINFDNIPNNEVIGIYGNNSVGKSTLIDIISYILFDKTVRKTATEDIINKTKNSFKGKLTIEVGKDTYVISISAKLDKNNKFKRIVKLYCNGDNLTGEQRLDTRKRLHDIIGDYNNFVFNSVCSQFGSIPFWEWTEGEQKKKLLEVLNFNSLDKIKDVIKKSRKEIRDENLCCKDRLNKENNTEFEKNINDYSLYINQLENKLSIEQNKYNDLETQINNKYKLLNQSSNNYDELYAKLKELERNQDKLNQQKKDKNSKETELVTLKNQLNKFNYDENEVMTGFNLINQQINEKKVYLTNVKNKKTEFNEDTLKLKIVELQPFEDKYNDMYEIDNEITNNQKLIRNFQNNIKPTNIKNNDDINQLEEYKTKLTEAKELQIYHNKIINEFSIETYNNCIQIKQEFDKLDNEIKHCKEVANKLLHYEYNPNCEFCLKNEFVQDAQKCKSKIPQLSIEYDNKLSIYNNLCYILEDKKQYEISSNSIDKIKNQISKLELKIENINNKINNIKLDYSIKELEIKIDDLMAKKNNIVSNYKLLLNCQNDIKYYINFKINNEILVLQNSDKYKKYFEFLKYKDEMTHISKKIDIITNILDKYKNLEFLIYDNDSRLENLKKEVSNIESNKKIEEDISHLEKIKNQCFRKINEYTTELTEYKTTKKSLIERLNEYNQQKILQNELQRKEELYDFLYNKLDKDGLKTYLLKYHLPNIESITNSIVNGFIDRHIDLKFKDDKLDFKSYTKDTEHFTQMHGGMESFILDLALKIAISKLSYHPKCTMLFIDERLSVLDKEHLDDIDTVLDFLKSTYEHTLIISHEQKLKETITYKGYVKKHNYLSKIEL